MTTNLFDISGKNILVTGSSRGLGFKLAQGLGRAGATIILNGRDKKNLEKAATSLKEEGFVCHSFQFDITKEDAVLEAVSEIESKVGPIHVLVNNAGVQHRAPLEEFELHDWQRVLETNLTGVFITTKHVVKGMIKRNAGKIINICSLNSELGRNTIAPYTASKGGLKMLTKGMAVDWGKYNIQTNGIGPGYFITEMTQPLADNPEFDKWVKARTPANRWGLPEELVGTTVFLASDASNFINGQIIYVDGGMLASL
jgi:gluconate 5-dehydrogenase